MSNGLYTGILIMLSLSGIVCIVAATLIIRHCIEEEEVDSGMFIGIIIFCFYMASQGMIINFVHSVKPVKSEKETLSGHIK